MSCLILCKDCFAWWNYLWFYLGFWPLTAQSILKRVRSSQRSKRNQTVPGEEEQEEIQASFGTLVVDFQPQFSLHKAGNSQRGGRPWLLIYSPAVVLLGLCLGTERSTIRQKLRLGTAAPVHLNKHLKDKTPPRKLDQSPASIRVWLCWGELGDLLLITKLRCHHFTQEKAKAQKLGEQRRHREAESCRYEAEQQSAWNYGWRFIRKSSQINRKCWVDDVR